MCSIPFPPYIATLMRELEKKVMVSLRDGRVLIGILRSVDQFSNLILFPTVERIFVDDKFGDVALGLFIVRGENMVLLGEVDDEREASFPLKRVTSDCILYMQKIQFENKKKQEEELIKRVGKRRNEDDDECVY